MALDGDGASERASASSGQSERATMAQVSSGVAVEGVVSSFWTRWHEEGMLCT